MKKYFLVLLFATTAIFAKEVMVNIEIKGVKVDEGYIYLAVYNSANSYSQKNPCVAQMLPTQNEAVKANLELPEGEYVFSVFQDINGNGQLDSTPKGMPIEPAAISNFDGKGNPNDFGKLKTALNKNKTISINLNPAK